jgi:hypothetical protein
MPGHFSWLDVFVGTVGVLCISVALIMFVGYVAGIITKIKNKIDGKEDDVVP